MASRSSKRQKCLDFSYTGSKRHSTQSKETVQAQVGPQGITSTTSADEKSIASSRSHHPSSLAATARQSQQSLSKGEKARRAKSPEASGARKIPSFFTVATQTQPTLTRDTGNHDPSSFYEEDEDRIEDAYVDTATQPELDSARPVVNSSTYATSRETSKQSVSRTKASNASKRFLISPVTRSPPPPDTRKTSARQALSTSWADLFRPRRIDDLAVQPKKRSMIRKWLQEADHGTSDQRLLVIRGPSGCGKSAAVQTIAHTLGIRLTEWVNPTGRAYGSEGFVSLTANFDDFLNRTSKFAPLSILAQVEDSEGVKLRTAPEDIETPNLLVVEDIPNTFSSDRSALLAFRSSILRYIAGTATLVLPMVMIITESSKAATESAIESFTAERLLGGDILKHPATTVAELNSVTPAMMTKALNQVVGKAAAQKCITSAPDTALMRTLSQVGDIRHAIQCLEFIYASGQVADQVAQPHRRRNEAVAANGHVLPSDLACRDNSIDIFHAVARVLYNKRLNLQEPGQDLAQLPQPPSYLLPHSRPLRGEVSSDELLDVVGTDVQTFIAALHENYILSCTGNDFLDRFETCVDYLSQADLLRSVPHDVHFHTSVKGLLFALPWPVKRGEAFSRGGQKLRDPFKMVYPTSLRVRKVAEEAETIIRSMNYELGSLSPCHRLEKSELALDARPYLDAIRKFSIAAGMPHGASPPLTLPVLDHHHMKEYGDSGAATFVSLPDAASKDVASLDNQSQDAAMQWSTGNVGTGQFENLMLSDDDIEDD